MSSSNFSVVIPARFESSRLPGKVLIDLAGKTVLQWVWESASASNADEVVIATDNQKVADVATAFGADVCMTSSNCYSGTDRVAETCRLRSWSDNRIVVNVQGDAPLIPPESIKKVADLLHSHSEASIATLCVALSSEEDYFDPNIVKVIFDQYGRANYFSRAPIPFEAHNKNIDKSAWTYAYRHLGLYAYKSAALQALSNSKPSNQEMLEQLEQLRALSLGFDIRIAEDNHEHGPDIDTADDLERVKTIIAQKS
ncbi:MAG: 3-deoxy-manno-octulosonate cytidylyltransferase [Pseudomonadota bacterium]|nr:3-deoxy-manno-octulosonate cytidylyltransferase [Pseudomonadota bacterium]